jgi:hypothetical protein
VKTLALADKKDGINGFELAGPPLSLLSYSFGYIFFVFIYASFFTFCPGILWQREHRFHITFKVVVLLKWYAHARGRD